VGLHARPARRRAFRRRRRHGPRALHDERGGKRRAADAAARAPAVWHPGGHVDRAVAAARSGRPRRHNAAAAALALAHLARGAERRAAHRARRGPRRHARRRGRDEPGVAQIRRAWPLAPGARRHHVRACAAGTRAGARARAPARPGTRPGRVRAVRHTAHWPAGYRPAVGDRAAAAGPELHRLAGPVRP
jgi:hypothetical protein